MKVAMLTLLFGIATTANALFMLTIEGQVKSFDENTVVLKKEDLLFKVPRRSIQSQHIRPGDWVSADIDSKSAVEIQREKPKQEAPK